MRRIEKQPTESAIRMSEAVRMSRWPLLGWILLSCSGTIILQSMNDLQLLPVLFFSGLMLLHASLLWHSEPLTNKHPWLYFLAQAFLINGAVLLMPDGAPIVLVGINPVMIGQSLIVFPKKHFGVLFFFFLYYALFCYSTIYTGGRHRIALMFPLFLLMTIVVTAISVLAIRQLQEQLRTQTFLTELEIAHSRVEELTIVNERQRMARDLHDTLAQGLAGLVMQLEAIDAHLSTNNAGRAREIVHQSMDRARKTLSEARQVIDDLRSLPSLNAEFAETLNEELERYQAETGIRIQFDKESNGPLSKLLTEHFLHIIRECLANTAKHADADQVWIRMDRDDYAIRIEIRDNGQGFDPGQLGKYPGHYGLLGIRERVRIIGGSCDINSGPAGTTIRIEAPLRKGDELEA